MNMLKAAILSLSMLTVMAGAAPAPALAEIARHFSDSHSLLIKMVISLPGIFIMITAALFNKISAVISDKSMALIGLVLYLAGGVGASLSSDIYTLLCFRAILGVGVGLFMPLSTGLISYYFEKSQQEKLMGYSSALNNFGGVLALSLSGLLVSIHWRYSFLIYLMGLPALILILFFLPKKKAEKKQRLETGSSAVKDVFIYGIIILMVMIIFYTLPTNFALIMKSEGLLSKPFIGIVLSIQTLAAVIAGLKLSSFIKIFKGFAKYAGSSFLFGGFLLLSLSQSLALIIPALFLAGLGLGLNMPILISQFSLNSSKENVNTAMAFMTGMIYFGQFISPIFIKGVQTAFGIIDIRFPFYASVAFSLLLIILLTKVRVKFAVK